MTLLLALASFVTLAAAAAAVAVWRQAPLHLSAAGLEVFWSSPSDVLLWWLGVMAVLGVVAAGLRLSRRRRLAVVAGTLAALLLAAAVGLRTPRPRQEQYDSSSSAAPDAGRRTLIIAVDGLSWNRLLPLVRQGSLPNFARLMAEGSYGVLHSVRSYRPSIDAEGYWSPVVWTSIATGVTPDKHGINDFSIPDDKGRPRLAMSTHRRVPAFWNIFSASQRRVGVVGWWATWPAEQVDGVLVSSNVGLRGHRGINHIGIADKSWFRKRRRLTYPEWYKHVVTDDIGLPADIETMIEKEIFPLERYPIREQDDVDTIRSVLWQDRLYLATTLHLLATESFSLYTTYFEGVDVLSHQFWEFMSHPENFRTQARFRFPDDFDGYRHVVDTYYEMVDGYVGQLLAAVPPDMTVILCSDHGFTDDPTNAHLADHSPYGVLMVRGPGVRRGHDLNLDLAGSFGAALRGRVSALDVLPTLLYLHDLPVSAELDGRLLSEMLEPAYLEAHPELTIPTYGKFEPGAELELEGADEKEYLERMRALGYVG